MMRWPHRSRVAVRVAVASSLLVLSAVVLLTTAVTRPSKNEQMRRLMIAGYEEYTSWFSGESLETVNGNVPYIRCPVGTYRPTATSDSNFQRAVGFRVEGCAECPRGRYGSTEGLTSQSCTAECPLGTYRDKPGAKSIEDCLLCPPGTYGNRRGLTTRKCSGFCPSGTYSDVWGLTTSVDCKACPEGYRGWQCSWQIVAQHFAGVRAHHHDLDVNPSLKQKSSPVQYREADNHPKPVDLSIPLEVPLVNERADE